MPFDLREFGEEFQPGKPLEVSAYRLPKSIRLENGKLFWEREPLSESLVRPTVGTFKGFLNLFDAPDEKILAYAKQWGPLGISGPYAYGWMEKRIDPSEPPDRESCDRWRRLAKIARAVLEISLRHRNDQRGEVEHWVTLNREANIPIDLIVEPQFIPTLAMTSFSLESYMPKGFKRLTDREMMTHRKKAGLQFEKSTIEFVVNEWLRVGGVRPALTLKGGYDLTLVTRGLFGSLSVQLLELVGGHMIAACTGCHRFFRPKRAPRVDQDRFCKPCVDAGVPVARAKHRLNLRRHAEARARAEAKANKAGKRGKHGRTNNQTR
jgi:hypothetical protein